MISSFIDAQIEPGKSGTPGIPLGKFFSDGIPPLLLINFSAILSSS